MFANLAKTDGPINKNAKQTNTTTKNEDEEENGPSSYEKLLKSLTAPKSGRGKEIFKRIQREQQGKENNRNKKEIEDEEEDYDEYLSENDLDISELNEEQLEELVQIHGIKDLNVDVNKDDDSDDHQENEKKTRHRNQQQHENEEQGEEQKEQEEDDDTDSEINNETKQCNSASNQNNSEVYEDEFVKKFYSNTKQQEQEQQHKSMSTHLDSIIGQITIQSTNKTQTHLIFHEIECNQNECYFKVSTLTWIQLLIFFNIRAN